MNEFENPYNFVPAPPRKSTDPELGDHRPPGHHRYHPGRVSGTIDIEIETVTPLLIPDEGQEGKDGHRTFGLRCDANSAPWLPPTSLKGMLRAAYEAVTNSRFGVFAGHEERLAYRAAASSALKLVPCRVKLVESRQTGERLRMIELLNGDTAIGSNGEPSRDNGQPPLMYAAWLRRYDKHSSTTDRGEGAHALKYPDGSLPQHGDHVWVKVKERTHRSDRFRYLRVTAIRKDPPEGKEAAQWREGWVYVSGPNIDRKHDEKVFLKAAPRTAQPSFPVSPKLETQWRELIRNYQMIHADDLEKRRRAGQAPHEYLGDEPGKTAFSRHVYVQGSDELKAGTLAYAAVRTREEEEDEGKHKVSEIIALYPVQISRRLYDVSPARLLDESLHPAKTLDELSPADRVFGWVSQTGEGAWRGQLRIGRVECAQGFDAIEDFEGKDVPLAILAAPKPQQARFYGARDQDGTPYREKTPKDKLYADTNHGLRGRKVYPHHALLDKLDKLGDGKKEAYWRDNGGHVEKVACIDGQPVYREWLRLVNGDKRTDDQNRSVTAWVKPGKVFRTTLHVTNLSRVEAGALLWLLDLPEKHYHRLGGGKPLGFGSVRVRIKSCTLFDGEDWRSHYLSFGKQGMTRVNPDHLVADFKRAVVRAYSQGKQAAPQEAGALQGAMAAALAKAGTTPTRPDRADDAEHFADVPFIRAFLAAAKGSGLPVRYPRATERPDPAGKQFEWFVENEKMETGRPKHGLSLPALGGGSPGLPYFANAPAPGGKDRGGRTRGQDRGRGARPGRA